MSRRETERRVFQVGLWLLVGLATLASGAPWLRAFQTSTLLPLLVVAAVVSVGVPATLGGVLARSATWSMLSSLLLFVVFGLAAVLREPVGFLDLLRGLGRGPTVVMTEAFPITQPRWVLIVPFAATWLVGAVSGEIVARTRRVAPVALVWLVGFVLASAGGSGGGSIGIWWTVALVIGTVGFVVVRKWLADTAALEADIEHEMGLARPLVIGAVSLLVVTALVGALVPRAPRLKGPSTSLTQAPPVKSLDSLSPPVAFEEVNLTAKSHQVNLYSVRVSSRVPGYLTGADLDVYNGNTWVLPSTMAPSGGVIPGPKVEAGEVDSVPVTQQIDVLANSGLPWMPFISRPTAVQGATVRYLVTSGMIAPATALRDGQRYQVTSLAAPVTETEATKSELGFSIGISGDPSDLSVLPAESASLGQVLNLFAQDMGVTPSTNYGFVVDLAHYFRSHFRSVQISGPDAADGQDLGLSYGDLLSQVQGQGKATSGQFATLFALLLRKAGDPARVVTGYRVDQGALEPGRTYDVTNADAWSWVEVPVDHLGWVVVDPSPSASGKATPPPESASASTTTTTQPPKSALSTNSGHALAAKVALHVPAAPGSFPWIWMVIGVAALGLLAAIGWPAERKWARRRRRRGGPTPRTRVLGAWSETLDVLYESRGIDTTALTGTEVVFSTMHAVSPSAAESVQQVAVLADQALFVPGATVSEASAEEAWRQERALVKEANRSLPLRDRIRAFSRMASPRGRMR